MRVRVRLSCCCGAPPPPFVDKSLLVVRVGETLLFVRVGGSMTPGMLWSFCWDTPLKGGGGLTDPVLNGGGAVGLNTAACGFNGFLPLVGFDASMSPSWKGAGLQLAQCCSSILGSPFALLPT